MNPKVSETCLAPKVGIQLRITTQDSNKTRPEASLVAPVLFLNVVEKNTSFTVIANFWAVSVKAKHQKTHWDGTRSEKILLLRCQRRRSCEQTKTGGRVSDSMARGAHLCQHPHLYRSGYFSKDLVYHHRSENDSLRGQFHSTRLPCFINKTLLRHSHTPLFIYGPPLVSPHNGSIEQLLQRTHCQQNLKYLLRPFTGKALQPCPFCLRLL